MLAKRLVVCLDVRDGATTKGIQFVGNLDIGDPVTMARSYYQQGVDELVFYDITASAEGRAIMIDTVHRVAEQIFIPFCVGGGISTVPQMREVLLAGAEKVSINSQAVQSPALITEGALRFGSQCIVIGMDVKKTPSGYRVVINGGRTETDLDAVEWARTTEKLGAGEIVLNSIDADGTKAGYELTITKMISEAVTIPVVASGGAGHPTHVVEVLHKAHAHAALVASIVHYGTHSIAEIKRAMHAGGITTRINQARWPSRA